MATRVKRKAATKTPTKETKSDPKPKGKAADPDEDEDEAAGKRGPSKKPEHPAIAELGEDEKLSALPEDWEHGKYQPLKRTQFENDADYYGYKASEFEHRAEKMREAEEEARKLGNRADRKKAKRLKKLAGKMAELKAQLAEAGLDVDSLLEEADAEYAEGEGDE